MVPSKVGCRVSKMEGDLIGLDFRVSRVSESFVWGSYPTLAHLCLGKIQAKMMMEKQSRERGTLDGPKSRITALCSMVSWHLSHAHQHTLPPPKVSMHQFGMFRLKNLVCGLVGNFQSLVGDFGLNSDIHLQNLGANTLRQAATSTNIYIPTLLPVLLVVNSES